MSVSRAAEVLFLSLSIILVAASVSRAQLTVTPSLSLRGEYTDNIFLTSYFEESDFVTTVTPALKLSRESDRLTLAADYRLIFYFYSNYSEENEVRHVGTLDSLLSLYRDVFFLKVSDVFERVPIEERGPVTIGNVLVNMTDSNRLVVNPYLDFPVGTASHVTVGYTYENVWYEEPEGVDSEGHRADLALTKELSPRLSASLRYAYLSHRPEGIVEYVRQDAGLGMDWSMTPRLTVRADAGHAWFDYKKAADQDSDTWTVEADFLLSASVTLSADYSQTFSESVTLGTYKRKAASAGVAYKGGEATASLKAFRNVDVYEWNDDEDRSEGVMFDSSIPVTPRMTGRLTGGYTSYEFFLDDEDAERYSFGLSLSYALRTFTASLGYTHDLNESSIPYKDYRSNTVWLEAALSL